MRSLEHNENRWMLVDPSMNMIDLRRDMFDFSNDVWDKLMKKEIDPAKFGVMDLLVKVLLLVP